MAEEARWFYALLPRQWDLQSPNISKLQVLALFSRISVLIALGVKAKFYVLLRLKQNSRLQSDPWSGKGCDFLLHVGRDCFFFYERAL